MHKFLKAFQTKRMKIGGYSLLISAAVIAIAIAVNYLAGELPSTVTKIDMSNSDIFTVSEQTEKIVKNVNQDVTVYLIAVSGQEDMRITEVLGRYKALNDKIKVVYKDPGLYPNFTGNYTSDTLSANSIIVESALRSKVIPYEDIYVTDYSSYYTTGSATTSFHAENAITGAINYVTTEDLPILYTLTGHGEATIGTSLQESVDNENIQVKSLSLLETESVPEDCDCLLINGPTGDISEKEAEAIKAYLEAGGSMLLFTDFTDTPLSNLFGLMENYGVHGENNFVCEGSQNNYYMYPYYLLPEQSSHEITDPLINGKYYILQPIAHGITLQDSYRSTLSITGLLKTTDSAYAKTNAKATTLEKESGDLTGPFYTGVAIAEAFDDKETKIVWFSSSSLLDENINQMVSGANYNLVLNSLGWMCDREETVSIRAVSLASEALLVTDLQKTVWSVVLCGILPLSVIVLGFVIWTKRRKRR